MVFTEPAPGGYMRAVRMCASAWSHYDTTRPFVLAFSKAGHVKSQVLAGL